MAGAITMIIGTVSLPSSSTPFTCSDCTVQAILTSSTTRTQLYVGRIVTGIVSPCFCTYPYSLDRLRFSQGNGFNSSSIPVYQSETCGAHIRGSLVCLNSTITIVGLVIVGTECFDSTPCTYSGSSSGILAGLRHVVRQRTCSMASSDRYVYVISL